MEVDDLTFKKAKKLQMVLEMYAISYDLYICVAAILYNKIPQDVTLDERATAKQAVYKYTYSN